ncbi:MAG: hypothetical protein SVS85_03265, partial [Candidatus Nanohaloarchaea archaeon]|nr:hypothetical protein [Candidatus Nanohaloarchaea archaeon]
YADISQHAVSPRGNLQDLALRLSTNASRQSILSTEKTVFRAVEASGTFTSQQKNLLRNAFERSQNRIPQRIGDRVQSRLAETAPAEKLKVEDLVAERVSPLVQRYTAPRPVFLAFIFLTVLSTVYLFKLPFRFIGAVYSFALREVRKRV